MQGTDDGEVQTAQGSLGSDRNMMLAIAKSLPDALKVVATSRAHTEPTIEDGLMQLHIGLDGASHTVSFRQGMRMDQLKDKVQKITDIPVEEQMYIFADDARLVDADSLVPLEAPLRCLRCPHAGPLGTSAAAEEETSSHQEEADAVAKESSDEDSSKDSKDDSESNGKWPFLDSGARWADIMDADGLVTSEDGLGEIIWTVDKSEYNEKADTIPLLSEIGSYHAPAQGSSLARRFTERWRLWDEDERQHQFFIAVPEHCREELQVVQQIKRTCPTIYKAQVMVRLRGRGSGFLEGCRQKESTDDLMICMSGRNDYSIDDYWEVFYDIAALLEEDIYAKYNCSITGRRQRASEIHLEDDWVNGGVRLHGEADPSSSSSGTRVAQLQNRPSSWPREFTDAWRAWDEHERQHQFSIEIPETCCADFQVVKRIKNACRDMFSEHVMLRCRGRGSGFLEGRHKAESNDPLMVCISGREPYSLDEYWEIFYRLAVFLEDDLYADYNSSLANAHSSGRRRPKPAHLLHTSVHGGVRKGGRMNECASSR